jgi:hypothetical protein
MPDKRNTITPPSGPRVVSDLQTSTPKGGQPSDAQIQWAAQDPANRQKIFDYEFGPGAYARAIAAKASPKK